MTTASLGEESFIVATSTQLKDIEAFNSPWTLASLNVLREGWADVAACEVEWSQLQPSIDSKLKKSQDQVAKGAVSLAPEAFSMRARSSQSLRLSVPQHRAGNCSGALQFAERSKHFVWRTTSCRESSSCWWHSTSQRVVCSHESWALHHGVVLLFHLLRFHSSVRLLCL